MVVGWRRRSAAAAVLAVVAALGLATPAGAADDGSVTFVGHGYGHGRGMGQYGAYGYAVDHGWGYQQILAHYYGGTTLSDIGNPAVGIELTRMTNRDAIVMGPGLAVNGTPVGAGAVRVARVGSGTYQAYTAATCGGPWTPWGGALGSGTSISTSGDQQTAGGMLRVCEAAKSTWYRGSLIVTESAGTQYLVNAVSLQDYLRGVVPREMPASWGTAGGGRGLEALKAQTVAARSYVAGSGLRASSASVCDSESCQVYGGAFEEPYGGAFKPLENANTDAAIGATAGVILRMASSGAVARAEYSSSTGGWTAGGTFPAVQDLGDATAANPNRTWSASFQLIDVAAKLGTGPIRSITVTQRNGLGAEGGRVLTLVVTETGGRTVSFTGDQVRLKLGLKSTWFSVSASSRAEAEAVVRSLYQDVLGRGPDPQGLENWTTTVMATGNPRLVADGIVNSKERLAALVAAEYYPAVLRGPEPGGLGNWVALMEQGLTVSDMQVGVYASPESLAVLGGGDVRTWVAGMYSALLLRPAAPSEVELWTQVAQQSGREAAVAGIAKSAEAGTRRLNGYYQRFLGRDLDPSGLASWLPAMSGRGDFTIPGMIGGSQEYWQRSQTRF